MAIWRVLLLAAAHFVLLLSSALAAYGWDLDHLSSRTAVSEAAGKIHAVLMFPHDAISRALPSSLLHLIQPLGTLLANSLLWGIVLYGLWRLLRIARALPGRIQRSRASL